MGVSMVSSFTGAASQNMACFIAGTMVLTTAGLMAIENIKAGDKIISTCPDTLETAEKTVLETYVRQVNTLVHLTINGEEIVTTDNHPFYVQGRGFIEAGNLLVGDKLVSVNGEDLVIEKFFIEECESPVTVHNFQVEDFHTYFVGDCAVWVHNAECTPGEYIDSVEKGETKLESNKQKGNYGEMKMDQHYAEEGYERISLDTIESLDDPIHHGIDGVYCKTDGDPKYIIAESKYGSSQLSNTKSSGKQMSELWIEDRLEASVGKDMADDILLEGYDRQLVRVNVGNVSVECLK